MGKNESLKTSIVKVLVLFVIITAGVVTGFFIAVKTGLTQSGFRPEGPEDRNRTKIEVGTPVSEMSEIYLNKKVPSFINYAQNKATVIAFVSRGCQPCQAFAGYLQNLKDGGLEFNAILFSNDPEYFSALCDFDILDRYDPFLEKYDIHVYPTIFGIDKEGKVSFVLSGFNESMDSDFILSNL